MLKLNSLSPKISAFLVQISPRKSYAEEIVIIIQHQSRRKPDLNLYTTIYVNKQPLPLRTAYG